MDDHATLLQALRKANLIGKAEMPPIVPLAGGVSGDVFRVDLSGGPICVKQPVEKLRVAADWHAPLERAHSEVMWLQFAASIDPGCTPEVIFEDRNAHIFAMQYLSPERYPGWKARLMIGDVDPEFAGKVGHTLARIHAASAGRSDIQAAFANQDLFFALRVEPYLLHTAKAHADFSAHIEALADDLRASRIALMHGDVSPKNILCGPEGPVFLDAETACYGDPVFDLAFCLNHLLLKGVHRRQNASEYGQSFDAMRDAYLQNVNWEDPAALDRRTARLLAVLLLARIDGKSPVEYLTADRDKEFVRRAALDFIGRPDITLGEIALGWQEKLAA
jgi:5-methylthioribose kinase